VTIENATKPRGLAAVPAERRREISRMGGLKSPRTKSFNEYDNRAQEAGRKGGRVPKATRKNP
jgi:general stress protein YciG